MKFFKQILNIKKSTPNCIVYGETGVLPLKVDIQSRMIGYWSKLVSPVSSSLSTKLYIIAKSYFDDRRYSNFLNGFLTSETY